jgi:hypothetical protein
MLGRVIWCPWCITLAGPVATRELLTLCLHWHNRCGRVFIYEATEDGLQPVSVDHGSPRGE